MPLYDEAQRLVFDDSPAVFTYYDTLAMLVKPGGAASRQGQAAHRLEKAESHVRGALAVSWQPLPSGAMMAA